MSGGCSTCAFCMAGRNPKIWEVIDALEAGEHVMGISRKLGVSKDTVTRVRKSLGIEPGRTPRYMTPERLERMAEMLNDGASFAEVARTLKVSPATLRKYFPGMAWGRAQMDEYASMRQREIKAERLAKKKGKLVDRPSVVD